MNLISKIALVLLSFGTLSVYAGGTGGGTFTDGETIDPLTGELISSAVGPWTQSIAVPAGGSGGGTYKLLETINGRLVATSLGERLVGLNSHEFQAAQKFNVFSVDAHEVVVIEDNQLYEFDTVIGELEDGTVVEFMHELDLLDLVRE